MLEKTKGTYKGQCRLGNNILEQWDGKHWVRVPDVIYPPLSRMGKIHFDVEDALHADDDVIDEAFRPKD